MRVRVLTMALLAAGCSPTADTGGTDRNAAAPVATPVAAVPVTPAMTAAKRVAVRYFDRLRARDYAGAYRLWGGDGADSGGSLAQFVAASAAFARYDATAGAPSATKVSEGREYVTVEAAADAVRKGAKAPQRLTGVVMLRRPAPAAGRPDDGGGWTIWGTDIRERHCRAGQTPRAFGCV